MPDISSMGAFLLQAIGGTVAEIGLDDDRIGDQLLRRAVRDHTTLVQHIGFFRRGS